MPTWTAPRLPPPASTKAVARRRLGRGPGLVACRRAHLRTHAVADQVGAEAAVERPPRRVTARPRVAETGGRCGPASWRSRHARRPAMSWRTAHTTTITTSTSSATTKTPKTTKKAAFVAGAAGTRAGAMQTPG